MVGDNRISACVQQAVLGRAEREGKELVEAARMKRALIIPILFLLASCEPVFTQEHWVDRTIRELNEANRGHVPDTLYVVMYMEPEDVSNSYGIQIKWYSIVRVFATVGGVEKYLNRPTWMKDYHCWRVVGEESVELEISVNTTRSYKIGGRK